MASKLWPGACGGCAFRCSGVCTARPERALRAAASAVRAPATSAETLLERHHRFLVAAICRITGRVDIAHDLAQEVYVKALAALPTFRHDAELTTWLYAIARNCCYDYAHARAARREIPFDETTTAAPVVDNAGLRALEIIEARRTLIRLMKDAALDKNERSAYVLHYGAELPLDLVTAGLGLSNPSGAKAPIVSARRKLHRAVQRWQRRTKASAGKQHEIVPS